ncbi:MAG: hypothetical protein E6K98_00410 [Thaumarchaeota archaeon]|nr:MAG: hypothetical protein E6K98_00410 [Nitrososphaerota archaeon]TLX94213.1 MAG: hypothetical protein E6K91_07035 [Nitrososphaerota archaeon]
MLEGARQFVKNEYLDVTKNNRWIVIKDNSIRKLVLEAFGDDDKKKILIAVLGEPMIISDILDTCKIAHTSGYRKMRSLISTGLLVSPDEIDQNGRTVRRYKSLIEDLKIDIKKNKVIVRAKFSAELLNYAARAQSADPTFVEAE